jgi:hypothetical protein
MTMEELKQMVNSMSANPMVNNFVTNAVLVFFNGLLYQVKKQKLYTFPTSQCAIRSIMMMWPH